MKRIRAVILTVLLTVCMANQTVEATKITVQTKKMEVIQSEIPQNKVSELQQTLVAPLKDNIVISNQYYTLTEEEFDWACKIVFAEAGHEDFLGKVYVLNCAINNAKALGISLIEEFNQNGRYSTVIDGQVYLLYTDKEGNKVKELVTENMITDDVIEAVKAACQKDYTEELLYKVAVEKGYTDESFYKGGARFFCAPEAIESKKELDKRESISVSFTHRNHQFYLSWE